MPSADFHAAIGPPRGRPSSDSGTRRGSPRLSLTTFLARPPDLQHRPWMDGGLCCFRSTRPTGTAYYPISVRRAAILLDASFRRRVTETPLRFANPSPPSSWIRDLHPSVVKHAWQTEKSPAWRSSQARLLKPGYGGGMEAVGTTPHVPQRVFIRRPGRSLEWPCTRMGHTDRPNRSINPLGHDR